MEHNADCYKKSDDPYWGLPYAEGTSKRIDGTTPIPRVRKEKKVAEGRVEMRVVNLRPGNIQRSTGCRDLEEWLKDENHVYIGRNLDKFVSESIVLECSSGGQRVDLSNKWGNPYPVESERSREECLRKYEKHARKNFTKNDLDELTGKELGCWCDPEPCHGHVLVKLHKEYFGDS